MTSGRSLCGLLAMTVALFSVTAFAEVTTSLWNIKKSDHFIVYYQDAPVRYIDELARRAEKYYGDIKKAVARGDHKKTVKLLKLAKSNRDKFIYPVRDFNQE